MHVFEDKLNRKTFQASKIELHQGRAESSRDNKLQTMGDSRYQGMLSSQVLNRHKESKAQR